MPLTLFRNRGARRRRLDLLPQVGDLVVDDALGDGGVVAPRLVDEHASRQHAPGASREQTQQLELERRRRHGLPGAPQFGATEIHLTVAERVTCRRRPASDDAAPQQRRMRARSSFGLYGLVT